MKEIHLFSSNRTLIYYNKYFFLFFLFTLTEKLSTSYLPQIYSSLASFCTLKFSATAAATKNRIRMAENNFIELNNIF